jgi:Spy/CpxP family protein refolding chaperone
MILISVSLALLAVTAGMFLLAKTRKESLGIFFKAISYFIIIAGFLIICLGLIGAFTRMIMRKTHPTENHECHTHHQYHKAAFKRHQRIGRWNKMQNSDEIHGEEGYLHNDGYEWEIKRLSEKLNLTSEQISKIREIFNKNIQQKEQQLNQRKEAIKKALNPEQLIIFNENKVDNKIH